METQRIGSSSLSAEPQPPSFNSYSSEHLADIAARVVSELKLPHNDPYDDDFYSHLPQNDAFELEFKPAVEQNDAVEEQNDEEHEQNDDDEEDDDDSDSEFEFVVLCGGEQNSSPISADEIFDNGHIKPMYPIFNTDLVYGPQNDDVSEQNRTIRLPLRKLMREDRENGVASSSSTSSEGAEELEGVPPGTYCVWAPKKKASQNDDVVVDGGGLMRKKSNSTGSNSKRWRFRDLLHRSNSDGKETFVFLTPTPSNQNHHNNHQKSGGGSGGDGRRRERRASGLEGQKKKSYLPYRQDLVGLFANANGISRTVRPF